MKTRSECGFNAKEYRHRYGCSRPDENEELRLLRDVVKKIAHEPCCDSGMMQCCDTYQKLALEALRKSKEK